MRAENDWMHRVDRRRRSWSDASGAAEADRYLSGLVDDDGDFALAAAVAEHALEFGRVFLDVDIFESNVPPCIVVPGGLRVGSSVLAEDVDHGSIVRQGSDPLNWNDHRRRRGSFCFSCRC